MPGCRIALLLHRPPVVAGGLFCRCGLPFCPTGTSRYKNALICPWARALNSLQVQKRGKTHLDRHGFVAGLLKCCRPVPRIGPTGAGMAPADFSCFWLIVRPVRFQQTRAKKSADLRQKPCRPAPRKPADGAFSLPRFHENGLLCVLARNVAGKTNAARRMTCSRRKQEVPGGLAEESEQQEPGGLTEESEQQESGGLTEEAEQQSCVLTPGIPAGYRRRRRSL